MYIYRFLRLLFAYPIFSIGTALSIQSGIGVNAWDTFALGVANVLPIKYGTVVLLTGIVVLLVDITMKQPIGIGMLLDIAIIGKTTDFVLSLNIIPDIQQLPVAIICLIISLFIQSFAVFLWTSAGLSVGPRDTMMIAIARKLPKLSIGIVKTIIEGTIFTIGIMLGAPIGIGTLICVFGIGIILQFTLNLFHLDLRTVHQESVKETFLNIFTKKVVS